MITEKHTISLRLLQTFWSAVMSPSIVWSQLATVLGYFPICQEKIAKSTTYFNRQVAYLRWRGKHSGLMVSVFASGSGSRV